jgi:hypothetical protein
MNQNRVEAASVWGESGWAGFRDQNDAGVSVERAGGKVGAMPGGQLGERLSDQKGAAFLWQRGGHSGKQMAESETYDEDFRLAGGLEWRASEAG